MDECWTLNAGGMYYYLRTSFGGAVAFSWTFINFTVVVPGRGLHSSSSRLNVSTFCGTRWVRDFPPV